MRIHRISSVFAVGTTILTAGLLIATSWETPLNRSSSVEAAPQNVEPRHASSPQPPSGYKTPLAEQRMSGGYWRLDHTFEPSLIITNFLQNTALSVTPVLYAADGTEYELPAVTLAPAGVASIDIRAALSVAPEEIKDRFSDYGSAAVKYVWRWSGAASALVENRDTKRSLNFGFELRTLMAMRNGGSATVQEGPRMWFDGTIKDAKIEDFHWHDLGHCFATRLRANRVRLVDIADALGHKTLTMSRPLRTSWRRRPA